MRSQTRLMRLGVWLATTSLSLTTGLTAAAQPAPPPGQAQQDDAQAGADAAGDQGSDPPALAGRVAAVTGSVSFHAGGETQWSAATLNYPVTNGEAFWTEPQAQATLEVADDRVVLAGSTELDVTSLDTNQFTTTAAQGAMFLDLRSLPQGQNVTVNTPRGAVQITATGRYEIVAGDTDDATTVSVVEGAAHVAGTGLALDVGPQQTATIGGTDTLQGSVGPLQTDAFLAGLLRAPARRTFAAAVPQQVQYMTGAADLQTYGSFTQTAQYGQVWYPRDVASTWAPYREGHWSYVQPWGWTWVDNARWGFAPFHYGRWVQVENRWGWIPGGGGEVAEGSPYPVYSPALVTFVDVGVGVGVGLGVGFGGGYAPAWIPLGPREPYYPWYHCQPSYFARLNTPYGVPQTIIQRGLTYINNVTNVNVTRNVFINQRAATVIPAADFVRGQPVASFGRPLPPADLARARPLVGRLAVAPTPQTPNLPQAAARRYNVALPATPVQRVTAGPRIVPAAEQGRAAPVLRRAAPPSGIRAVPAAQVRNGQPAGEPGTAPLARQAGTRPGQPAAVFPGAQPGPRGQPGLPTLRSPGAGRPEARTGARPEDRLQAAPQGAVPRPQNGLAPAAGSRQEPLSRADTRPQAGAARPGETGREPVRPAEPGRQAPGERSSATPALREGNSTAGRPALQGTSPAPTERRAPPAARAEPGRLPPGARPSATPALREGSSTGRPAPQGTAPEPNARRAPPAARAEPAPAPRPQPAPAPRRADVPRAAPPSREAEPRAESRPAPRAEAPRPAPRPEPPRAAPAAAPPRAEPPRPAPRAEAPRPAPRPEPPRAEPPRPAPHPAPPPARKEPPKPQ